MNLAPAISNALPGITGRKIISPALTRWLVICGSALALCAGSGPLKAKGLSETDRRVETLLGQMTLDEKIGQMTQVDSSALKGNLDDVRKYCLGSVLSGGDSDPVDNLPDTWRKFCDDHQALALQTRLKIPLLYGIDAVHGHNNVLGAVIFPHNIGMGAAHDPALVEREARVTAEEVAGTGAHWAFAPCMAVAQNIRWGRSYESYSSDPALVGQLGAAAIKGFQRGLPNGFHVLACAKHFAGDGGTQNGIDQGNTVCDEATFRKLFLTPYVDAIKAGAKSIMVSYSSWNGQKMSGNKYLLTDVLKEEMGFKGFLVSDWAAIDQLSGDYKDDIETSINAGMDMVMIPNGEGQKNNYVQFITLLHELVTEGKVPQERIDDAVRRILRVKYEMGLFEHPYADPKLAGAFGGKKHREVARQCVRESLVLLKNDGAVLPLSKKLKHLVVFGEGADDLGVQCGGWTIDWQGKIGNVTPGGTTILAAIRNTVTSGTEVSFSPDGSGVKSADAVIVVVGEKPYAEMKGDRSDLRLSSDDLALIDKAKTLGAPVVTILLSGRPLILGPALRGSDAFIAAWLPGTEGQGVADVLFGDYRPTGKLSFSWPESNEQLQNATGQMPDKALFPIRFGLSY